MSEEERSAFDDFMKDIEDRSDEINSDISNNAINHKVDTSGRYDPPKQKMEFSKKMFIYAGTVNTIVIIATLYVVIKTYNTAPLNYLIPSVAAEVSSIGALYLVKSKLENVLKILVNYNVAITENIIGKILNK